MIMNRRILIGLMVVFSCVSAVDHECYKLIASLDNNEYSVEMDGQAVERSAYLRNVIAQKSSATKREDCLEMRVPVENESELSLLKELCELQEKSDVWEYLLDPDKIPYTGGAFQQCQHAQCRKPYRCYKVREQESRFRYKLLRIADLSKRFDIKNIDDVLGYITVDEHTLEQYCKERQAVDEQNKVHNRDTQQCVTGLAHIKEVRRDRIPVIVCTDYHKIDGMDGGSYDGRLVPRHFLLRDLMDMELAFHMQAEGIEFFMRPITTKMRMMALRYLSEEWHPNDPVINYARRTIFLKYQYTKYME